MNLYISGEKIDFTIEHEKNLLEVHASLQSWLIQNNMVIIKIKVDDQQIPIDHLHQLEHHAIESTTKMDIECENRYSLAFDTITTMQNYLLTLEDTITNNMPHLLEDRSNLLAGIAYISQGISTALIILNCPPTTLFHERHNLQEVMSYFQVIHSQMDHNLQNTDFIRDLSQSSLLDKVKLLGSMLPKIPVHFSFYQSLQQKKWEGVILKRSLEETRSNLESFPGLIPEIRVHLQTGRDLDAIAKIKNLLNLMDFIVLVFQALDQYQPDFLKTFTYSGNSLQTLVEDFNEVLSEIYNAFKENDLVLLSDLFEYELMDRFERFKLILKSIESSSFLESESIN